MFNALLIAVAVASSSNAAAQPKPAKQLVCSAPQGLTQGSGTVKVCEWK